MDKVEYKIRADEIKALIGEGRYADAVKIADTIDWKRVRNVSTLCTISDLYKINRRLQESRDILLMAYDRHPTGRPIVYSLCELAIKMGEFVQAVEYYKEFVRIAPRDTGRYILQYKLYEAQEVSLEERIAVLEELKKHDYQEKWAYELAYLYHRVGLTTECIEECDEIFLWFGEGRYVMKALELKALHEPLSPEQQDRYIRYKQSHGGIVDPSIIAEKDAVGKDETRTVEIKQPTKEMPPITDSVIEAYANGQATDEEDLGQTREFVPGEVSFAVNNTEDQAEAEQEEPAERDFDEIVYPHISEIKEPSVDVSTYNTINLQESLAQSLREVIGDEAFAGNQETEKAQPEEVQGGAVQPITEEIFEDTGEIPDDTVIQDEEYPQEEELLPEEDSQEEEPAAEPVGMQEVFFDTDPKMGIEIKYGGNGPILGEEKKPEAEAVEEADSDEEPVSNEEEALEKEPAPVTSSFAYEEKPLEDEVPGAVIHPNANYQMHSHFENMLSQEYDGQISLAVEPEPEVEKQITGQISIAEYLDNWEQFKKDQQQKQLERVKKRVADETGDMFADFDEKTKAGLQEKIEKAINDAIKKESYEKASGRGNWNVKREDVINAAVAEVIENENIEEPEELPEDEEMEASEVAEDTSVNELPSDNEQEVEEATEEMAEPADEEQEEAKEAEEPKETEEAKPQEDKKEASMTEESESDEDEEDEDDEEPKAEAPVQKKEPAKKPSGKKHIGNRELEERVRTMTPEEKELFGPYIHHKKSRRQIINAIDNLSMDPFSGNAIVTGEEGAGTVNLAKGLIKAMQASDSNFSGKVAKITANTLNKKSTASIFDKLANGALIIQRAADLTQETVSELLKILQEENKGLVLVMEDTKEDMDRFLDKNPSLKQSFNVRVDIEALDDDSLVAYARQYALEKEYAIDNLGILALHTRISERQTLDHDVTVSEVKDIVDDAIYYAEKRSVAHFVDVLVHKRYDENDMIILREKDFMHD
ncbi:MAG: hypothetical protein J6I68_06455 [Butyrivibrio sp.]|uniref:tetratricopeptide repeat protein n=1 Tax=Butyrivibrio sp. TaxID=28121 RepID=UPI001B723885|nr:hypothetical protein [Butyrivibrio sp.]MBP3782869.1 hypothetical protein [Butyrivibrio sp.]